MLDRNLQEIRKQAKGSSSQEVAWLTQCDWTRNAAASQAEWGFARIVSGTQCGVRNTVTDWGAARESGRTIGGLSAAN